MKMKKLTVLSALFVMTLFSCTKETATNEETPIAEVLEQAQGIERDCGYVDSNWPSTAKLSTTLTAAAGTSADATFLSGQNTAIKTFWRGATVAAPTFRFVNNGKDWNSTYNAISYSNGKIYFGEGIFKDAKSKDATNLINVMILAHEYGHQLQYAFNLPSKTESTVRSGELEADGMAGYYLRRGYGKTSFAQISTAYEFAASIGDKNTTSSGHHGLPAQRRSAVRLGFLLADASNPKLNAKDFDYNFFYYYEGVLAGTYRMAKPANIDEAIHSRIMLHMDELMRIKNGQMSDQEYFNLN
ncbi:metalloprotease [Flavobacterium sp.]|uniref:metalloprotease n=1 Tax=Flavobacterium sp. TaxID=239 RepID=UPI003D14CB6E